MNTLHRLNKASNFFTIFGIGVIAFIWFALILGSANLFFAPLLICGFSLIGTLLLFLLCKILLLLDLPERSFLLLFGIIAFTAALPVEPTVFTGRDQGAIATAAIELATQHSFRISLPAAHTFFSLYGPGLAYNFPGFFYTHDGNLLTQFPLAYTAWLGSFYSLFSLNGLLIGNGVLLCCSLFAFFFLLRIFLDRLIAFSGTLLFSVSFLPIWFVKFTLTENLALFLFIFLSFSVIRFIQSGTFLTYMAVLSSAGLFCFTRIEGYVILPFVLLILSRLQQSRQLWKQFPRKSLVFPALLFLLTTLVTLPNTYPFFITIGKALQHFFLGLTDVPHMTGSHTFTSLFSLFVTYGLVFVFLFGFISIYILIRRKAWLALIPLLLALPTTLYFIFPNITADHPWMLRRYLPTLYPTFVFLTSVGLGFLFSPSHHLPLEPPRRLHHRFLYTCILIGLFACQIGIAYQALLTRENTSLLEKTRNIASNFGDHDLILIDKNVTGSGFAMIAGPLESLYHKNAVYFFNPEDLRTLDRSPYEHTWLIIPMTDMRHFEQALPDITFTPKDTLMLGSIALKPPLTENAHSLFPNLPEAAPFYNANVILEVH